MKTIARWPIRPLVHSTAPCWRSPVADPRERSRDFPKCSSRHRAHLRPQAAMCTLPLKPRSRCKMSFEVTTCASISWAEIAKALDGAKARVFVLLDACQSGAAADGGSNDDAVTALLSQKASITVIAAAKGRQYSLELGTGGAFTTALVRAITEDRKAISTRRTFHPAKTASATSPWTGRPQRR
jgi:caspase domain-containing protein